MGDLRPAKDREVQQTSPSLGALRNKAHDHMSVVRTGGSGTEAGGSARLALAASRDPAGGGGRSLPCDGTTSPDLPVSVPRVALRARPGVV
jgi:hypothetical protein